MSTPSEETTEVDQGGGDGAGDISHKAHRKLIGTFGLALPPFLWLLHGLRPTPPLPRWEALGSLSAYYYTGAVAVFVGVLCALAAFLSTYRGYKGAIADRRAARVGGIAALGVAIFPTGAPFDGAEPAWWTPIARTLHYISAVTLFAVFAVFALWLFRKSNLPKDQFPSDKLWRNRVYFGSGLVIVAMILLAGSSAFTGGSIFWPESIALWAFAIAWLVKGYAHRDIWQLLHRRGSTRETLP